MDDIKHDMPVTGASENYEGTHTLALKGNVCNGTIENRFRQFEQTPARMHHNSGQFNQPNLEGMTSGFAKGAE